MSDSPKLIAAFNFLAALITCACMIGTSLFFVEANVIEPLPVERIHAVVAKADRVLNLGSSLTAIGVHGTVPLVLIRLWIGGLDQVLCIVLTAVVGVLWAAHMDVFLDTCRTFSRSTHSAGPRSWPTRYKKDASHAAVDEMIEELQYKRALR